MIKTNTHKTKENNMDKIIIEKASQMAIMDAMENGHTEKKELIEYMNSKNYSNAVTRYINLFNLEFK